MKMEPFTKSPLEDKFYHSNFWEKCFVVYIVAKEFGRLEISSTQSRQYFIFVVSLWYIKLHGNRTLSTKIE